MTDNPKISIVIPVYCSEKILPVLVKKIHEVMQNTVYANQFELILVNDGSADNSFEVITALAKEYKFLVGICLMKNAGQHNAIMAGLRNGKGEIFVIMDDDLQHPPEQLPVLIAAIEAGSDVCYTKYLNSKHALWKRMGSWFNDRVATILTGKSKDIYLSSFKALHQRIVNEVVKYEGPFPYIDGLILGITRNIASVDIQHQSRYEGDGNYNLRSSISLWLKMATNFSILPLRIATLLGIAIAMVSALFILFVLIQKILYPEIPAGWTSIFSIILFMGGVQLCALGIIGEYVGRTYLNVNKMPQYTIRSLVRTDD